MAFQPKTDYDAVEKMWSSEREKPQFGESLSIGEIIFQEMRRHPKGIAQISDSEKTILLREDLLRNSIRIATYMRNLDLSQFDIVGIIANNSTHIAAVAYACFFNGIALHSLNSNYIPEIIEKLFLITKPRLIFCDGEAYPKVRAATAKLNVEIVTMCNISEDVISIQEVLQTPVENGFKPTPLKLGTDHQLAILSTSGSTGNQKAVVVTNSRAILCGFTQLTTEDVQYASSGMDWALGLYTIVTSGVFSTRRIISEKSFDPSETLRIIDQYQVTWVMQPPGQVAAIVNCPDFEKANLQSLRYYIYTGGRCTMEVQGKLRQRIDSGVMNFGFGLSETASFSSLNWHYDAKPNSVGRPSPGYKLKIINDQGESLGPNEEGEVCLNTGATDEVYKNSWLHSGDLGYMDDDGFLYIVDRKKDVLKYAANKYYPHEVEDIISGMPGVLEVCAFGIWNMQGGDAPAANVVLMPSVQISEQDVEDYVAQHANTEFLRLHAGCLFINDLKRSPNGKTNRAANKDHFLRTKGVQIDS
uniref:Luciferin 4-monooxygenase-like n=1 Tax=Drosophila rhopaloa TaxID=1041015 RepID=A0A6P4EZV2_DRORH